LSSPALLRRSAFVLALVLAREGASLAAPPDPAKEIAKHAEQIFHDAEALFDQKRYPEACAGFAESQRLDPKLGTLLNLAFCHETMGKLATAWSEYNEAAVWASQRGQREREEFARKRSTELARRLSRVLIELAPGADPASIDVDGEALPREKWLTPLFLDPGAHAVVARAPGKKTQTISINAAEGVAAQTIRIAPFESEEPAAAPAPAPVRETPPAPPPEAEPTASSGRRTLAIVLAGAGVVGLGLGAYFGLRTLGDKSDATSGPCDVNNRCTQQGVDDLDQAHTFATVSTVAFGVGAAGLVAAAILWFTDTPAPASGQARIVPVLGAREGGLAVRAAW
jgi:hypothetical protein